MLRITAHRAESLPFSLAAPVRTPGLLDFDSAAAASGVGVLLCDALCPFGDGISAFRSGFAPAALAASTSVLLNILPSALPAQTGAVPAAAALVAATPAAARGRFAAAPRLLSNSCSLCNLQITPWRASTQLPNRSRQAAPSESFAHLRAAQRHKEPMHGMPHPHVRWKCRFACQAHPQ